MNRRVRTAFLFLAAAAVLAGAIWGGLWYRSRPAQPAEMLRRLPTTDALVLYLDLAALRREAVLALLTNAKIAEDPEYLDFVRRTGFDYSKDLDSAMLAVAPTGKYLVVQGRFDWGRLRAYAESQHGRCDRSLCRMPGSTPDRLISFFPLRSNLMALAVGRDDSAALRLSNMAGGTLPELPGAPLWVSIPKSVLRSGDGLPAEAQIFAHGMSRAESVFLSFVPEKNRFSARLTVICRDAADASGIASQLTGATTVLREILTSQHHAPAASELAGVLLSGSFRSQDSRVYGYWPIERDFVRSLLGIPN